MAPKSARAPRAAGSAPKRAPRKKKADNGSNEAGDGTRAEGEENANNVNDVVQDQPARPAAKKGARGKKAKADASEASDASDDDVVIEEEDPWKTKEELEDLEKKVGAELIVAPEARESMQPPPSLVIPLLSYQKEFLAWAIKQELGPLRGGVLADEMGMGKTLQAVCVIVTHPRDGEVLGGSASVPLDLSAPSAAAEPGPGKQLRIAMPALPSAAANPPTAAAAPLNKASGSGSGPASDTCVPMSVLPDSGPDGADAECAEKQPAADASDEPAKQAEGLQSEKPADDSEAPVQPKGAKGKGRAKAAKKPRVDPLLAAIEQAKHCRAEPESGSGDFCGATLVVCPVVAAMQWRQEILRYTTPGSVKVLLYHGTNRNSEYTREQLESADIVLTTYSILEVDFRKNCMAPKATCEYCSKKFQPERLKVHLRYFCGPYAAKTEAQAKQQKKAMPWMRGPGKGKGKGGASTSKASTSKAAEEDADGATQAEPSDDEDLKKPAKQAKKRGTTSKAAAKKQAPARSSKQAAAEPASAAASAALDADDDEPPMKKRAVKAGAAVQALDANKCDEVAPAAAVELAPSSAAVADDEDMPMEAPAPRVQRRRIVRKGSAASSQEVADLTMESLEDSTDGSGDEGDGDLPAKKAAAPARRTPKGKKGKSARKVAPKKAAGAKRKRASQGAAGSETEGSDWAPDSSESEAAEDSGTESDILTVSEAESEVEVEDDEEDDEGAKKRKGRKMKEELAELMDDEALEEAVEKAAARMIAAAARERSAQSSDGHSLLHEIRWRRIILDEAHNIKDRRCNTAQSAFALTAAYRWCLSGTPLQNRVTELYSLVRFLRIYPYSHYFADKTSCCSLDFPFKNDLRKCDLCGGSRMSHYCWWNRRIANPIKFNGYEGRGRTAMLILKHQILPRMLLRRTKMQCADDLALPPRRLVLRKDPFDAREADFYEALYTQSQAAFSGYVDSGTILNNYAHIFDLLIRLRQAVNHPYLVVYSASGGRNDNTGAQGDKHMVGVCGICHDPLEDGLAAECSHTFCRICVTEYLDNTVGACTCPTCSRPLTIDLDASSAASLARAPSAAAGRGTGSGAPTRIRKTSILSRLDCDAFQTSTKLEALLETIEGMRRDDVSAKCIVFSQFTSMLDLVQFRLQQAGVRCIKLEGSMSLDVRARMIETFNSDPEVTCFLMSLKAGGVALNLTVASHVMLMDPWWNPAVEQQAQDRIHRLGQYKPITVTRFIIAGTIEERILKLQEKKQLVFEGTVGRDSEALGKLTVDDLRFLFG